MPPRRSTKPSLSSPGRVLRHLGRTTATLGEPRLDVSRYCVLHRDLVRTSCVARPPRQAERRRQQNLSGCCGRYQPPEFQNNPVKYIAEMVGIEQRNIDIDYALGVAWSRFILVKFTLLGLPLILVCTFPKEQYLFAVMMFGGVLRSVSGSMSLNTQLLRHQNSYTTFRKLVQEELGKYEDPPEQMPLPAVLTITDIDIRPPAPAEIEIDVPELREYRTTRRLRSRARQAHCPHLDLLG